MLKPFCRNSCIGRNSCTGRNTRNRESRSGRRSRIAIHSSPTSRLVASTCDPDAWGSCSPGAPNDNWKVTGRSGNSPKPALCYMTGSTEGLESHLQSGAQKIRPKCARSRPGPLKAARRRRKCVYSRLRRRGGACMQAASFTARNASRIANTRTTGLRRAEKFTP